MQMPSMRQTMPRNELLIREISDGSRVYQGPIHVKEDGVDDEFVGWHDQYNNRVRDGSDMASKRRGNLSSKRVW